MHPFETMSIIEIRPFVDRKPIFVEHGFIFEYRSSDRRVKTRQKVNTHYQFVYIERKRCKMGIESWKSQVAFRAVRPREYGEVTVCPFHLHHHPSSASASSSFQSNHERISVPPCQHLLIYRYLRRHNHLPGESAESLSYSEMSHGDYTALEFT